MNKCEFCDGAGRFDDVICTKCDGTGEAHDRTVARLENGRLVALVAENNDFELYLSKDNGSTFIHMKASDH